MLRMYQLWLDDLYPRAKFSDGLQIIEKLGHTKEMQMLRKQWIDEDKHKPSEQVGIEVLRDNSSASEPLHQQGSRNERTEQVSIDETASQPGLNDKNTSRQSQHVASSDQPEDDELDALLAAESLQDSHEQDSIFGIQRQANISRMEHEYEDDEDALREMGMF